MDDGLDYEDEHSNFEESPRADAGQFENSNVSDTAIERSRDVIAPLSATTAQQAAGYDDSDILDHPAVREINSSATAEVEQSPSSAQQPQNDLIVKTNHFNVKYFYDRVAALLGEQVHERVEDEESIILARLREKFPYSPAFEVDSDPTRTVAERLIAFELEELIKKKRELINERKSRFSSVTAEKIISSIPDDDPDVDYIKNLKKTNIQRETAIKKLQFPPAAAESFEKEVSANLFLDFY